MRTYRIVFGVALAAIVASAAAAAERADGALADAIHLDAIITDAKQRPIRDLRADDFEISDSGERRTVDSVKLQSGGRRIVAIFLDEYHVAAGDETLRARAALMQFVDTQLRADDLAAIMKPLDPLNSIQLSQDRSPIRQAIEQFTGRKGDYTPRTSFEENFMSRAPAAADTSRAQIVTSALQALAIRLGDAGDARKAIILVSNGFPAALLMRSDRQQSLASGLRATIYAANRYGVAMYPLSPRLTPAAAASESEPANATLTVLAEQTGGKAGLDQAALAPTLRQVVTDLDTYYLVTYRAARPSDGKFHPVNLRVKRPDAQIRTRSGYWAALAPLTTTRTALPSLVLPVRPPHSSPYIRPWIGMSRGPQGNTTVTVTWEPGIAPPRNQQVTSIALKATSGDGQVLFQDRIGTSEIDVNGATQFPRRATFSAPPGHLSLEMAVQTTNGTALDTDYRGMQVPDLRVTKATIATPQLLRTRTARAFNAIVGNPDAVPAAAREFSRAERLLLRVPAFAAGDTTPTVTATLLNRKGTPMRKLEPVAAALPAGLVQFDLPLSWLAPDDYRVEIVATAPGPKKDEAKEILAFRVID